MLLSGSREGLGIIIGARSGMITKDLKMGRLLDANSAPICQRGSSDVLTSTPSLHPVHLLFFLGELLLYTLSCLLNACPQGDLQGAPVR